MVNKRKFDYQILAYPSCFISAVLLRNVLSELTGLTILITSHPEKVTRLLLRYGDSSPVTVNDTKYNSPEFIRLCSNKLHLSRLLLKNNFISPEFLSSGKPNEYPVVVRSTLTSYGGKGIVVCKSEEEFLKEFKPGYYWTKFFRTSSEYRIHIVDGNILKIFRKVATVDNHEEFPIRNMDRGWHFSIRDVKNFKKLPEFISKVHAVMGGGFYALDIAVLEDDNFIVWENNTGMGLSEITAKLYAESLVKALNLPVKEG
jgi:glutathione synthase/RimK-type ligase-like ATP-grasp enzyme